MKKKWMAMLAGTNIVAMAAAGSVKAQDKIEELEEIVVTGTQIRGIAPAGSAVISVSEEQIKASGATSTNRVLATMPQVQNYFGTLPSVGGGSLGGNAVVPINRPNLRALPAGNTSGSPQTLILIDGFRVVPAGIQQVAVDPDVVTPAILERVEVITDGGSAVYGSDAIGGVINFITRRSFEGLETSVSYGTADDYTSWDASLTAGTSWGSGSVFGAYTYSEHDALWGRDRDYHKAIDWSTGLPRNDRCDLANIQITGSNNYAFPGPTRGSLNLCDATDDTTMTPEETRNAFTLGLSQDFSETVKFDLRGLFSKRENISNAGPIRTSAAVTTATPTYVNLPAPDTNRPQNVLFSYGPALGNETRVETTTLESWQVTPKLSWDVGGGWLVRGLASYGESETVFDNVQTNTALERTLVTSGAINPYNVAASRDLAAVRSVPVHNIGDSQVEFLNTRVIGDGPVFTLPGGQVRAAIGAEYMSTDFKRRITDITTFRLNPYQDYKQDVISAFAEAQVPIVGDGNAFTGMHSLLLSASVRYDEYNDFGSTTNPKFGITYEPVEWLTIRGNWGESFTAPSPSDQLGTLSGQVLPLPSGAAGPTMPDGLPRPPFSTTLILLRGSAPGLEPQTSENWSVGLEIRPLPGLMLSASYYGIEVDGLIGQPVNEAGVSLFFRQYPNLWTAFPTQAQLREFCGEVPGGLETCTPYLTPGGPAVALQYDIRVRNLGLAEIEGIDFSAIYNHPTDWGSYTLRLSGNNQIKREETTALVLNTIARDVSTFRATMSGGFTVGGFTAEATFYHTHGYDITPSPTVLQTEVDAFDVFDLFFNYDVNGTGLAQDLSFSLNVGNVFDENPPEYKSTTAAGINLGNGYTNGQTLGRLFQLGVTKRF